LYKNPTTFYQFVYTISSSNVHYQVTYTNLYNIPTSHNSVIFYWYLTMNYESISNKICHLVEQTNIWPSTITIRQDDEYLDISSAAMGKFSTAPIGASDQPFTFPKGKSASVYRFDPQIFNENSRPKLKDMLTKVGCVSGCRLTVSHVDSWKTCNRLAVYMLIPKLEQTLFLYGEFPYGSFLVSLPISIRGSPYGNGDPLMVNIPIWGFLPQSPNWSKLHFYTG
jgi:hypothetical protein